MAFSGLPSDSTPVALTGVLFSLALDGVGEIGYFTKVSGISIDITPVEYNATRDGSSYLKTMRPGRTAYGDIEFSRGLSADNTLEEWADQVARGDIAGARSNGSIVVMSADASPIAEFNFFNGWPSRWSGPSLSSSADETAVESLTVVVEGIERVS